MGTEQTLERMRKMRLSGMVQAYLRDSQTEGISELSFEERLALMVDHEWTLRESNRIARLRKKARFRIDAMPEDIDYEHPRGLKRRLFQELLRCDWIRKGYNVLIIGPRAQYHSTLVASQLPIEHWHQCLGDSTVADAILDRIIHNAYKVVLRGESMRKIKRVLDTETEFNNNQSD